VNINSSRLSTGVMVGQSGFDFRYHRCGLELVFMMTARTKGKNEGQWGLYGSEISLVENNEPLCA
jgi:hypothetical protein